MTDFMVFTGNANPDLANKIVEHLGMSLGDVSVTIKRVFIPSTHVTISSRVLLFLQQMFVFFKVR